MPESIQLPPPWRRRGRILLVVAAVATGLVCVRSAEKRYGNPTPGTDHARYHDRTFRVARVVDGDTLDIRVPDGDKPVTRIRLWGVDTPEVGRGDYAAMHFGLEAGEFAKRTLAGRDVHVVLVPGRTRGKYGRLLAYVFLERGAQMFNEMLLEKGYAYADLRFDHPYYKQFKDIEKRARRGGVGLWAAVTLDKMPGWKQRFERRALEPGD